MCNYYEIILFTCSTQNYADSIVKAIEYKKKYFDYILLDLIDLREKCRLCSFVDIYTFKQINDLIEMLRYYRQFSC